MLYIYSALFLYTCFFFRFESSIYFSIDTVYIFFHTLVFLVTVLVTGLPFAVISYIPRLRSICLSFLQCISNNTVTTIN